MKQLVSDLAWAVAVALAVTKLVDLLLSGRQKQWLSDKALQLWDWLASQRAGKFVPVLWSAKFQFMIFAVWFAPLAIVGVFIIGLLRGGAPELILIASTVAGAVLLFRMPFVTAIREAPSVRRYLVVLTGYATACALCFGGLLWLVSMVPPWLPELAYLPILVALGAVVGAAGLLWQTVFASIVWLMLVMILWLVLLMAEFVLRRILEQSGGIVGGIAALLAAAGGLLKAL